MVSIERGQIYFINLNPVRGREQAGTRPVLVLSTWTELITQISNIIY
ncbi:type II toxin-antitoxin system PemK/MazF family toxin [Nostoc sp.]